MPSIEEMQEFTEGAFTVERGIHDEIIFKFPEALDGKAQNSTMSSYFEKMRVWQEAKMKQKGALSNTRMFWPFLPKAPDDGK